MAAKTVYAQILQQQLFRLHVNDPKNELLMKSYYDLIGYTSLWIQ